MTPAKKAPKKAMMHTNRQTDKTGSSIRKMPTVAPKKGTLHPQHVADKKASKVSNRVHGNPSTIKTPEANMPNNQLFHKKAVVRSGKHMATAGGVGKASKRVPDEQASMMFVKSLKARKSKKAYSP